MQPELTPQTDNALVGVSRHLHLPTTLLKFLFIGALAYFVNQGVLFLLYDMAPIFPAKNTSVDFLLFSYPDVRLLVTSFIAVQCAILFKFGIHEHWTFRGRGRDGGIIVRFVQFNLSSFLGPVINLVAVNILTPLLDISPYASNTIGAVAGFAVNWLLSAHIIWPRAREAADTPAPS